MRLGRWMRLRGPPRGARQYSPFLSPEKLLRDALVPRKASQTPRTAVQFFASLYKKFSSPRDAAAFANRHGKELEAILADAKKELSQFDSVSLARIVHALGKMSLPLTPAVLDFVKRWAREAEPRLAEFDEQSLSLSLYGLAKLNVGVRQLGSNRFFRQWASVSLPRLASFHDQHLSNCIYSAGLLRLGPKDLSAAWFGEWSKHSMRRMSALNEQHLSNCAYGLGLLGDEQLVGHDWFMLWTQVTRTRMSKFTSQALSNSVLSLAKLQLSPAALRGMEWFRVWSAEARRKLPSFSDQQLSNSMYALGVLGVGPSKHEIGAHFFVQWGSVSQPRLKRWNEQMSSNALYGMALVEGQKAVGIGWFREWARVVEFDRFTDQGLVNVIHALGEMRIGVRQLGEEVFRKWAQAARRRVGSFTDQGVSNSLYALGKLRLATVVGKDFVVDLAGQARRHFSSMYFQGLSNVLSAMEMMELGTEELGRGWFEDWIKAARGKLGSFEEKNIARVVTDLARLRIPLSHIDGTFLQQWADAAMDLELDPRRAIFMLAALRDLGVDGRVLGRKMAARLAAHLQKAAQRHAEAETRYAGMITNGLESIRRGC